MLEIYFEIWYSSRIGGVSVCWINNDFSLGEEKDDQIKAGLTIVYDALRQKDITLLIRLWDIF